MSHSTQTPDDLRPLSPHLTIYKPQISSVLSISHRLSGVALFVGMLVFAWGLIGNIYSTSSVFSLFTTHIVGQIILFLWSLAMYYHLFSGIRHLFWDMGKGFSVPVMNRTGWLVVIATLVCTTLTWLVVLGIIYI